MKIEIALYKNKRTNYLEKIEVIQKKPLETIWEITKGLLFFGGITALILSIWIESLPFWVGITLIIPSMISLQKTYTYSKPGQYTGNLNKHLNFKKQRRLVVFEATGTSNGWWLVKKSKDNKYLNDVRISRFEEIEAILKSFDQYFESEFDPVKSFTISSLN